MSVAQFACSQWFSNQKLWHNVESYNSSRWEVFYNYYKTSKSKVHVQANYREADIIDWFTRSGKRSEEDPPAGNIIQLYSRRAGDGEIYIFSTLIRWVKSPINQMNRDVVAKGTLEMKFVFLLSQGWIVLGSKLSSFKWVPWNILRPNLTHLNQFSPFRQIDAHFSPL